MKRRMTQFLQWIKDDKGFSLIELVVAISIMIVLTAGGLIAYTALTKNAKQAAVNSAVDSVYTATIGYLNDGLDETTVQTAAEEWNSKVNDQNPAFTPFSGDLTGINNDVTGSTNGNTKIKVFVDDLGNDRIKVTAIYAKNEVEATKMSPAVGESTTAPTTPVEPSETEEEKRPTPPIMSLTPLSRQDMTVITYLCSEDTTSTLPFVGMGDKADVVTLNYPDDDYFAYKVIPANNQSTVTATAKANVLLRATLYGTYDEFNGSKGFQNCKLTMEYIGQESGVKKITQLPPVTQWGSIHGGGYLLEKLPRTVTNLDYLMVNGTHTDNGGYVLVERWDTSNVTSMKGSFKGVKGGKCNFDTNTDCRTMNLSNWNVSNVTDHTDFDADNANIISPVFPN